MSKSTSSYPALSVTTTGTSIASGAGGVLLARTAETIGRDVALTSELSPWPAPLATLDPGKIVLDLAMSIAAGGDCLADVNQLRAASEVYGRVASDPTVSRLIGALAADPVRAEAVIGRARAAARDSAWTLAGHDAPNSGATAEDPLILDLDATLVTVHSEKQHATPTFKRGFGFHPLCASVDHGQHGSGEPLTVLLRPGNAASNTAADHITVLDQALAQLPGRWGYWIGHKVLVRIDGGGGTHEMIAHLHKRRLAYSVGFSLTDALVALVNVVPKEDTEQMPAGWVPAIDDDTGKPREGAWVSELTDLAADQLATWPPGMRLIIRAERPHPGAQLRYTDKDGHRLTAFVTNSKGKVEQLELRHRQRARCEDRIRNLKDTGLTNLPLKGFDQNRIWIQLIQLAAELLAWRQTLALTGHQARRWEPKRLRHRLLSIAGRVARHARTTRLNLAAGHPHTPLLAQALARLQHLTEPA